MNRAWGWIIGAGAAVALVYWLKRSGSGGSVLVSGPVVATGAGGGVFEKLAAAIYDFEDPNRNGPASRNNNPGNLKPPNGGIFWNGQTGVDAHGFAVFGNFVDGWNALITNLKTHFSKNPNQTLLAYFNSYTSDGAAVAANYAAFVAKRIGASVTNTLAQIGGGL